MNLTDLLMTPQNIEQMSRQFEITQDQAATAMSSLLPALSQGLKRNAATGQDAASFIQALATGRHAQFAEDPTEAMTRRGVAEGNAILGHIFKTPDVSRSVASHAAASSGIGASLLKQMLPVLASMVMGAIFKGATGGGGGSLGKTLGGAVGGGLLGTILEGLVSGGGQAMPRTRRRKQTGGLEDMIGDVLGGMLGGTTSPRPKRRQPTTTRRVPRQARVPKADDGMGGLGDLLDTFLGGGSPSRSRTSRSDSGMPPPRGRTQRPSAPRVPRQPRAKDGFGDIFGDLLEPGPSSSTEYQRKTRSVIDELLGN